MYTPEMHWFVPALAWWSGLILLALALWPWTARLFRSLPGRAGTLALPGGTFVYLFAAQTLWRTHLLSLHPSALLALVLSAAAIGWHFFPACPLLLRTRPARNALLVFTIAFFLWAGLRAADPAISHTEQPMDLMWMRAAATARTPPIPDPWFDGAPASYYAEGHQMLALLALLFGTPIPLAYSLTQITWFALTCSLAFAAGSHLIPRNPRPALTGTLSVLLLLSSNPAGALHALRRGLPEPWWWSSTRILHDSTTELITEFPFFSFWLGDNHAHLIALPILLLSLLASLQLYRTRSPRFTTALPAGLALIWSINVNPWQAPTALALPLLPLLLRRTRPTAPALAGFLLPLLLLHPIPGPSPFQGLALNTFGLQFPAALLLHFGFFLPGLLCLRPRKDPFPFALLLLSLAMLLTPEFVFARDLFGTRMNTIFKVYYQVWPLLALLSAAGLTALIHHSPVVTRHSPTVILLLSLLYPLRLALPAWNRAPRSLHPAAVLPADTRELLDTADRLIAPGDRILEAPGTAYDPTTSLLSTWTAGHTPLGWTGHQQQWRPDTPLPDILPLFSTDPATLLHTHNIRWVLLGPRERALTTPEWRQALRAHSHIPVETTTYQLHQLKTP